MTELHTVIGGIDTHADTHHAAVLDDRGRLVGTAAFPATGQGYRDLLTWIRVAGRVERIGVEGTGSYGAGLTRYLQSEGVTVIEVNRPHQQLRRRRGKSDPIDAEGAARMVLAGEATALGKDHSGIVEAIRVLRVARSGAVKSRTAALNQLKDLITTAPETIRAPLRGLRLRQKAKACAQLRPDMSRLHDPTQATLAALRALADRIIALTEEITRASKQLRALLAQAAPRTMDLHGVSAEHAGQLLATAGDNPHRLRSEAAFAALCAAAPIPASSGKTDRHRLNPAGDRNANQALHMIVVVRAMCGR